jgi:hypothetical protein
LEDALLVVDVAGPKSEGDGGPAVGIIDLSSRQLWPRITNAQGKDAQDRAPPLDSFDGDNQHGGTDVFGDVAEVIGVSTDNSRLIIW